VLPESDVSTQEPNTVDRIAVVVTGGGTSKLLAVQKVRSGSGEAQAKLVFDLLEKYCITNAVVGMSYDTTSSNTGVHKGAAVLLEHLIGRSLLRFPCRHHIMELISGSAFITVFGKTSSPDVALFNNFKSDWGRVNQAGFKPLVDSRLNRPMVKRMKCETIAFLEQVDMTKISILQ
jgi:hypothetical protein